MKLNIRKGKNIVKVYTADTYDLLFGTLEDFADAIKLDKMKTGSNEEILTMAFDLIKGSKDTVKDLLKGVFEGITDAEIRCASVSEIAKVIVDVVKYTIAELGKGINEKN